MNGHGVRVQKRKLSPSILLVANEDGFSSPTYSDRDWLLPCSYCDSDSVAAYIYFIVAPALDRTTGVSHDSGRLVHLVREEHSCANEHAEEGHRVFAPVGELCSDLGRRCCRQWNPAAIGVLQRLQWACRTK